MGNAEEIERLLEMRREGKAEHGTMVWESLTEGRQLQGYLDY